MPPYKSSRWPTERAELDQQNIVARAQSASAATTSSAATSSTVTYSTSTFPDGGSTVIAAPDAVAPPVPIPIGAIVGGICGGIAIVVLAVIAWKWWGICIRNDVIKARRKKRARRMAAALSSREKGTAATKEEKTQPGSSVIREKPAVSGTRPPSAGDRKVKFAPPSARSTRRPVERSTTASPQALIPKPSSPKPLTGKKLQRPRHARTSSRESRTYATTRSSPSQKDLKGNGQAIQPTAASLVPPLPPIPPEVRTNMDSQGSGKLIVDVPPLPTPTMTSTSLSETSQMNMPPPPPSEQATSMETLVAPRPRGLNVANIVANGIRRISTLTHSSGSIYSRASNGEEISRRWSWLFVTPPSILGGRGSMIRNRSSGTSSSRTNGSSRVQVGYAYGGDDNDYEDNDIASDDSDMDSEEQFFDCEEPYGTDSHV